MSVAYQQKRKKKTLISNHPVGALPVRLGKKGIHETHWVMGEVKLGVNPIGESGPEFTEVTRTPSIQIVCSDSNEMIIRRKTYGADGDDSDHADLYFPGELTSLWHLWNHGGRKVCDQEVAIDMTGVEMDERFWSDLSFGRRNEAGAFVRNRAAELSYRRCAPCHQREADAV